MTTSASQSIRVRFAPSPTGHLHIGGLRSAYLNWLFARHYGGTYLLRIEDTDIERSRQEYVDSIMESFAWVGLQPDEPVVFQMSRHAQHRAAIQELLKKGAAYPCFCSPVEAEDRVRSLELGIGSKYPGTCRNRSFAPEDLERPHAVRFRMPQQSGSLVFHDLIRDDVSFEYDQFDDFVLVRRDGVPTYNFVVVVDDIFMRITHIIRGEEHLSNTPKQILLYQALGEPVPQFAHLPMILGPSGNKLSKRDGAVSVIEYCQQGFLPQALLNYLVRLGWSHGDQEVFTSQELIQYFSLEAVGKKGAIFDHKKLEWLNGVYIRKATAMELREAIKKVQGGVYAEQLNALWSVEQQCGLIDLYKERAVRLTPMAQDIIALAHAPEVLDVALIQKWKTEATKPMISAFMHYLADPATPRDHDTLLAQAQSICNAHGAKLVQLAQPLRLALTGQITSPGVFEILSYLSKNDALKRLQKLLLVSF